MVEQKQSGGFVSKLLRLAGRLVLIVAAASLVGWLLNHSAETERRGGGPAGFAMGMLHGAMMPCAMPHLVVGHDVSIYAQHNNGRFYKLGYTAGVNLCGLIFFGLFFWRVSRWRLARQERSPERDSAGQSSGLKLS